MKRVLITGGSGFIGQKLAQELLARGDRVTVLARSVQRARGKLPAGVRVAANSPDTFPTVGTWGDTIMVAGRIGPLKDHARRRGAAADPGGETSRHDGAAARAGR